MDAGGKDGTIRNVFTGVNPAGFQVSSFKAPSDEELDHDFLWRVAQQLPERGRIGVFNRSHYEEVLVVRVHPEFLEGQRLPNLDLETHGYREVLSQRVLSRAEEAAAPAHRQAEPELEVQPG
jgi:polyphosphate kinase 2 (PPK2 family)